MSRATSWAVRHSYTGVWSVLAGFAVFIAWTAAESGALVPEAGAPPAVTAPSTGPVVTLGPTSGGSAGAGSSPTVGATGPIPGQPGSLQGDTGGAQQIGLPLPGHATAPSTQSASSSPAGPATGPTLPPTSARPTPSPVASTTAPRTVLAGVGAVATDLRDLVTIVVTAAL